jgi:dihydroorotase
MHTLVRGKFVMRDRALMDDARGWGRSVHAIQEMPQPAVRNADKTLQAVTAAGPNARKQSA